MAKPTALFFAVILSSIASASAGDGGYYQHASTTVHVHSTWDDQPRGIRTFGYPFVFLGRVGNTILQSPRILAEGLYGERALVNQRGVLAPREVPVEDRIISPAD